MTVGFWPIYEPLSARRENASCFFANRFPGIVRGRQLAAVHLGSKRLENALRGVDPDVRRDQHFFHLIQDRRVELAVAPKYAGEA